MFLLIHIFFGHHRFPSYKCGGTLIDSETILTAAHCLYSKGVKVRPAKVIIQLGKHFLNQTKGVVQESRINQIIIHANFDLYNVTSDIAILKLERNVTFTDYVQPALLWPNEQTSLLHVIEKLGTVVGWGLTETDINSEVLKAVQVPVMNFTTCLESNRDFFGKYLSANNYCAGFMNGSSPCNGDSGGGMFFELDGTWYIRGIVSLSPIKKIENENECDPDHYILYTDVAQFIDWIKDQQEKPEVKITSNHQFFLIFRVGSLIGSFH